MQVLEPLERNAPAGLHVRTRAPKAATAYVTKYMDYSPIAHRGHADASADGYSPIASLHLQPPPVQTLHSGADLQPDEHLHSEYVTREMGYSPIDHINVADPSQDGYSPISALHFPPRGIFCAATQVEGTFPCKPDRELPDSPLSGLCKPQMSHFEAVLLASSQKSSTHGASSSGGGAESLHVCDADYSPIARICDAALHITSPCNGTCAAPQLCASCCMWNSLPGASDAANAVRAANEAARLRPSRTCPVEQHVAPRRPSVEKAGPLDLAIVLKATAQEVQLQVRGAMRVLEVKYKVWELTGVRPEDQRLLLEANGQQLDDERLVDDYCVQSGCAVRLQ